MIIAASLIWTGCIISEYDPRDTPEKKLWESKYCYFCCGQGFVKE